MRIGRATRWLLAALLLAATVEQGRELAEARAHRMPGELVDLGGRRLHLTCQGHGSPVVVLIPGAGETSAAWGWIAPAVAKVTRVCAVDRAGRGWSDPAPSPQDGNQVADDLDALLERGGVEGPVVLVGHSFGGLYLRAFAVRHPERTAGAVLLDATHPQMFTRLPSYPVFYRVYRRVLDLVPALAHLGGTRLINLFAFHDLPEASRGVQRALWATPRHARSQRDEWAQAPAAMAQAAELRSLGGRPLIVVTAGEGAMEGWMPLQEELAALSSNSLHRVVAGASHVALVETQAGAAASAQAIADVVLAVRSGRPLR